MKKKTAIIAALCLVALTANAVNFVDTSRPDSYRPDINVHAGAGVSTILQNYRSQIDGCAEFYLTPGCQSVFGVNVELPLRNFFGLGTGMDYIISNYNYSMTILAPGQGTVYTLYSRNNYHALEIPLYMLWRFNIGSKVHWDNQLGIYLSQGVTGRSHYKSYVSSTNDLGQSQVTTAIYHRDYYKDQDPLISGNSRTDYGLHIATGLMLSNHWTLNCVMHIGFVNVARNLGVLDIHQHNLSATFRVGYTF